MIKSNDEYFELVFDKSWLVFSYDNTIVKSSAKAFTLFLLVAKQEHWELSDVDRTTWMEETGNELFNWVEGLKENELR